MKKIAKEVQSLLLDIINSRVKEMQAGQATNDDLLNVLLESNYNEMQQHGNKSGMSLDDVVEECKLFYLAGQETTLGLLVWTLVLLGKHLDWQTHARDEVIQVFGNNKPDIDGLNRLKVASKMMH